jgi:hypothetical protein
LYLNKQRRNEWDVKPCFDQANRLYEATYSDASAWALPVALVPIFIVWGLGRVLINGRPTSGIGGKADIPDPLADVR